MTRDEHRNKLCNIIFNNEDSIDSRDRRTIEYCIDYFQSMTCENCKHAYNGGCMSIGDWDCYNDDFCDWIPPFDDFGCNKFERKD